MIANKNSLIPTFGLNLIISLLLMNGVGVNFVKCFVLMHLGSVCGLLYVLKTDTMIITPEKKNQKKEKCRNSFFEKCA